MFDRSRLLMALFTFVLFGCGGATTPARPAPTDPQVITFDAALGNKYVRANSPGSVVAEIRIGTRDLVEPRRAPINLALVVDTSGSMEGKPIEDARAASLAMVDALVTGDRLAVVAFHSKTDVLLPSTELDDGARQKLKKSIREMRAQGTTDLAGGLAAGIEQVAAHLDSGGINRVVLVGDGVPNDESQIRALAQSAGARGISITSLGLGPDYNESLMGAIAQLSGGAFHYVEDSSKVAEFFQGEVLRLQRTYARNAYMDLSPGPGVRIESVVGHTMQPIDHGVRVTIGDIAKSDKKSLIVRLAVDEHRDGAPVEIADAVLSFDDAFDGRGRLERRVFLGAHATRSDADFEAGRDRKVEDDAAGAQAAAATLEAIERARQGDVAGARAELERAADEAHAASSSTSSPAMEEHAKKMRALRDELPAPAAAAPGRAASPARPSPSPKVLRAHDEAFNAL